MGALDQVKSIFTNDVKIDDPEIRQALKNAFPSLAKAGGEFDDLEYLPSTYIQEKIVPALMTMDEARLQAFKLSIGKASTDLHSLARDVESSLRYKPRDGRALPSNQQIPDRLKSSAKGVFKDAQTFITETFNLRTDAEKEEALMAEIIASANRSVVKFDRYVQRGDGKQYGDKANDWLERDSKNVNLRRPETTKNIRHNVENVPKIDFVTVVNEVVAMAQEPSVNVNIDGIMQSVGSGTRIEKLAYLASWLSALEEGTDKVLPNMLAEAAANTTVTAVDTIAGTAWDTVTGVTSEYPVFTTLTLAAFGYATWMTGNLVKGILNIPSVPFKLAARAAGAFGVTSGVAPHIKKFADIISFKDAVGATGAAGSPGTAPEGPKPPRRYAPVNNSEVNEFRPGEKNHLEYFKKTITRIQALTTVPAGGGVAVSANEASKRETLYRQLDEKYRRGSMSLSEYLKKTEDTLAGRGRFVVTDSTGKVQVRASMGNVVQRLADRTPLVSQMSRNFTHGSATTSVNAINAAKSRIKGTAYTSVDLDGNSIDFEDSRSKVLYEEFRDEIKKYRDMQEWGRTNTEIQNRGARVAQLDADVISKDVAIASQEGVLSKYPTMVQNPAGNHLPPMPNPDPAYRRALTKLETLNSERGRLDGERQSVKTEVSNLVGKKIAEFKQVTLADGSIRVMAIPGEPLDYAPVGGSHANFVTDINTQKLKISSPGVATGLIQRINTILPADSQIPESIFNRKVKLLDIGKLLEVIKKGLAK